MTVYMNFRYEIFMDEVRPQDLSVAFLKEFMNLPTSYYAPGSPLKYRKSQKEKKRREGKGREGKRREGKGRAGQGKS